MQPQQVVLIQQQAHVKEATARAQTAEQERADMARTAARLAARAGDGNSIFAKIITDYHASHNHSILVLSFEAIFTNYITVTVAGLIFGRVNLNQITVTVAGLFPGDDPPELEYILYVFTLHATTLTRPTSQRRQPTSQQRTCSNNTQPATDTSTTPQQPPQATTTTTTHTTPHQHILHHTSFLVMLTSLPICLISFLTHLSSLIWLLPFVTLSACLTYLISLVPLSYVSFLSPYLWIFEYVYLHVCADVCVCV